MRFIESEYELQLDGDDSKKDYIQLSDGDRLLKEIRPGAKTGKGKNSCVFRAVHPEGGKDVIVKFCRFPDDVEGDEEIRRRKRFTREITALKKAATAELGDFLIDFYESGSWEVDTRTFSYYIMEEAECDLSDFLAVNRISLQQKLLLCLAILQALQALHGLGIYHRDLKPDNIFFVDRQWKIGDLGFIRFRDEDVNIDAPGERIGPTGLMSPEATNKLFEDITSPEFQYDCAIDELSDVYQLGNVFWFILQGNLPTGQLRIQDFKIGKDDIFERILLPMLQHGKPRRPSVADLLNVFRAVGHEYAL